MPTSQEYQARIQAYSSQAALLDLWQALQTRKNLAGRSKGKAFEYLVIRAFELEGASVRYPYSVREGGDEIEQIDGVIYAENLVCLVESKHQHDAVNFEPIAKLRQQLLRRPPGTLGIVFSYQGFTNAAVKLLQSTSPQMIMLWEGKEIQFALETNGMIAGIRTKNRYMIEEAITFFNIRVQQE